MNGPAHYGKSLKWEVNVSDDEDEGHLIPIKINYISHYPFFLISFTLSSSKYFSVTSANNISRFQFLNNNERDKEVMVGFLFKYISTMLERFY